MAELKDIKDRTPNADLIDQLEQLLADAKSGELRTMLSICSWDDNTVSHGWALDARTDRLRMLGEILIAQHNLTAKVSVESSGTYLSGMLGQES